jgi:DNA polymerase III epsilon subunit family exonuclease
MSWKSQEWFIVDTETTGLEPESERVVELGGVWFSAAAGLVSRHNTLLNPGIPIPAEATAIHGISDVNVEGKPSIADVAESFCGHVRRAPVIVAYNAQFDLQFLDEQCPGFAEARSGTPVIDPLMVIRKIGRYWPGKGRHKLTSVCSRFGIQLVNAHRAWADCVATGHVLTHVLAELPDDAQAAADMIEGLRVQQDAQFQEWLAKQPPREDAG